MPGTRRDLVFGCLVLLLISAPPPCAQQAAVGSIIGELHLSRSDFPGRVLVELQLRSAPITSVYSDDQGKFGFYGLGSNPYHVVIHDERFYPIDQLVVVDVSVSVLSMVQIILTPRELVKKDPLPNRELGGNPHFIDPSEYRLHFSKSALKEFDRGVESDRKGKRDEAIHHYEKAVSLAPDFYPAHNNLGADYLSKSDLKSAQAQFEEAIKLNRSDAEAHLNLASVLLQTKKYEDALSNVEEGLRKQPSSALGKFILGAIYRRMGRAPEAEKAMREALQLDPNMSNVHLELVNLYLGQQKTAEAKAELEAFLEKFPNDPHAPHAKQVLAKLQNAKQEP
jgi:tetratricopeptide (TPR) repeat protein